MTRRELDNPLRSKASRSFRWRWNVAPVVISAAVLVALAASIWVAVVDDPEGGRPVAIAAIEDAPAVTGSLPAPAAAAARMPAGQVAAAAATSVGDSSGLLEPSQFGMLPRVAPDGRRPREVYARRGPAAPQGLPRIALVVGGLGISQTGTQRAIESLPEGVTLAFAPLGSSLQRWVDRARAGGHEILLQIPLEPEGYPERNPGEHTLLVDADRSVTERELRWNLARVTGYAGVVNYMGGRFSGDERALALLLGEIGARGLFYLDDGSSEASRAGAVGAALEVPVVGADVVVDRSRAAAAIEAELAALETIAREKGSAVGVATAFPATVEILAAWAREAEKRGFAIVPATALLASAGVAAR